MKPYTAVRRAAAEKEFVASSKPVPAFPVTAFKEFSPMETQPNFTLTFSVGTSMREIHDAVIQAVLQATSYNRLLAAQILQINPRTIRRRLGKKERVRSATRAA